MLGLDLQHLRDRDAQRLGLDDGADEVGQRLHVGPRDHVPQGISSGFADPNLRQGATELIGQRAGQLLDYLRQRGVEAQTGPNRDRKQVEGVRDHLQDQLLAALDAIPQPELRDEVADTDADQAEQDALEEAARQHTEDQEHEQSQGDAHEHLDAHPVGQFQVAGVAGHGQTLLRDACRRRTGESVAHPRQPRDEGSEGAFRERLLELEFLEVSGLERAQLSESCLDRIDGRTGRQPEEDQQDAAADASGNDEGEHLRPRWRRCAGWP